MARALSDSLWRVLACPRCGGGLARDGEDASCEACRLRYPRRDDGALDLRLQGRKSVVHEFRLGVPLAASPSPLQPLPLRAAPEVDFRGRAVPYHLTRELLSHFPRAKAAGERMLDLGCGSAPHREACEAAGFEYVGLDYDSAQAMLLGDAHALPFRDASFAFVLSIAVLEHLRFPAVALREARRVMQPGAALVGTVAFLEPFHADSYYHHTHLGLSSALQEAGFVVEYLCPSAEWSGLRALAQMGLFPRMPAIMVKSLLLPLELLHRAWWAVGSLFDVRATDQLRVLSTSGAFSFVVRAPGRDERQPS